MPFGNTFGTSSVLAIHAERDGGAMSTHGGPSLLCQRRQKVRPNYA